MDGVMERVLRLAEPINLQKPISCHTSFANRCLQMSSSNLGSGSGFGHPQVCSQPGVTKALVQLRSDISASVDEESSTILLQCATTGHIGRRPERPER